MAFVIQNAFDLLINEDGNNFVSQLITDVSSKKAPTLLAAGAKKKNSKKPQAGKKKVMLQQPTKPAVAQENGTMKEPVIHHQRPKQKFHFEVAMQDNQQNEERVDETKLTLKEYEKELLEKKQALNAVWKPDAARKVNLDKDFESMKLVHKKKVDDDYSLSNPKKKEMNQHNEGKADDKHKLVIDMHGFLKPLRRRENKTHLVAANGGIVKAETTFSFQDAVQFLPLK